MVIADTSAWIPYFRQFDSLEAQVIDDLLSADRLVLVGVVLAELLQGSRSSEEREEILFALAGARYIETDFTIWRLAGELSASLRRRGTPLPLSDLIIGSLALEHGHEVYTLDAHFQSIPGLRLYQPARP